MADLHKLSKATFRPPTEVKNAAQQVLAAQEPPAGKDPWTLNDVLVACLALLAARPRTFLRQLEPYRPPRKRGRPRKQP